MFYFLQAMESSLLYAIGFTGNVRDELSHGERDLRAGAGAAPGPTQHGRTPCVVAAQLCGTGKHGLW